MGFPFYCQSCSSLSFSLLFDLVLSLTKLGMKLSLPTLNTSTVFKSDCFTKIVQNISLGSFFPQLAASTFFENVNKF